MRLRSGLTSIVIRVENPAVRTVAVSGDSCSMCTSAMLAPAGRTARRDVVVLPVHTAAVREPLELAPGASWGGRQSLVAM